MKKKIYFENQETNYSVTDTGEVWNDKTNKQLKGTYARNEYHSVQLTINGKAKTLMTHRLVAEYFLDNPNNLPIVDHINRDKHDNRVENLRWVNQETNMRNIGAKSFIPKEKTFFDLIKNFEGKKILVDEDVQVNKFGDFLNFKTKNYLKGSERMGYIRIYIKGKHYSAYRLVWKAFNGPIPEGKVIDHIDGNRSNNALSNLRLVSQSDNMGNAQFNGHAGQVGIKQYDLNGIFIKEYTSIHNAAIEINGSEYAIKEAANRHGSSANFLWIRNDDEITIEKLLQEYNSKKNKKTYIGVSQYDTEGNLIKHYDSLKEAARELNCADSTVKRAADAQRIGKGYYWILDNQDITINDLIK